MIMYKILLIPLVCFIKASVQVYSKLIAWFFKCFFYRFFIVQIYLFVMRHRSCTNAVCIVKWHRNLCFKLKIMCFDPQGYCHRPRAPTATITVALVGLENRFPDSSLKFKFLATVCCLFFFTGKRIIISG